MVTFALVGVVLLAAVGVGVNALVRWVGHDQGVIVITDEGMRLGPASSEASTAGREQRSVITIHGPATISRPAPTSVVLSASWGSGPEQFGLDESGAGYGPSVMAVSEWGVNGLEGRILAVADQVNSRVQLFLLKDDGSADLLRSVPLPSVAGGLSDMVIDPDGHIYVLSGGQSQVIYALSAASDDVHLLYNPTPMAVRLHLNGFNLFAEGADGKSYGVTAIFDYEGGPGDKLRERGLDTSATAWAAPVDGVPVPGSNEGRVAKVQLRDGNAEVRVVNTAGELRQAFVVTSPDLPIDSAGLLGQDAAQNLWVLMRIYADGWEGTESFLMVGVSPEGTKVGELRLPLDAYATWDVFLDPVFPFGVYEMRGTEEGLEINRYSKLVEPVTTTTVFSPEETAQQWYERGYFMGYWAGNVETIPVQPASSSRVLLQWAHPFSAPGHGSPGESDTEGPFGNQEAPMGLW